MAAPVKNLSVAEQIQQLNAARKIVLADPEYYDKIVKGILPIIGPSSPVELRRWGAEFLAESLSTPALKRVDKENLAIAVLETLRSLVENPGEDPLVLKASVMAAASAYPIAMRWVIFNSYHKEAWDAISAIKARVKEIWDTATTPVRICCIKFIQRVVLAQTVSNGMESKEQKYMGLDVSLSMIPPNHPLIDPRLLEAEGAGLLDKMLMVLQENSSDALLVDATLNTLSILIRTRPTTSGRILNTVLGFNPLKLANSPLTPRNKVLIKSMEKTTRMLLLHLMKRDHNNPITPRIQQHVERLMRSRTEILDEGNKKRGFVQHPASEYNDAKRQRVDAKPAQLQVQPLAPGPQSLAALFTITNNPGLQGFNATLVPVDIAAKINVKILASINPQIFGQAVDGIRTRLASLYAAAAAAAVAAQSAALNPDTAPLGVNDDDDDYEPFFNAAEDTEQILNKLDGAPPEEPEQKDVGALAPLGPFRLPPPPPFDVERATRRGQSASSLIFGPLPGLEEAVNRKHKAGINRLAASSYDRDSWLTFLTRLPSRATSGAEDSIKAEPDALDRQQVGPKDVVRELMYNYVLEDWRRRIEVAVAWLCEEWYNDQLIKKSGNGGPLYYEKWALRLIDGILTYITAQDKVLTRFLAEIPELTRTMLGRLKGLCGDPTRVQLALTTLLYLVMMRPPVREMALDTVAAIWDEYEEARPLAGKYLVKWRPGFIESKK
ncbi:hypothetical protein OQA88_3658 [Cercophora sp. LCS_1]